MNSRQTIAYEALRLFEVEGELPEEDAFDLCVKERDGARELADRYTRLIDECHHAEHLRRSPKKGLPRLSEDSSADGSNDYLPRSGIGSER